MLLFHVKMNMVKLYKRSKEGLNGCLKVSEMAKQRLFNLKRNRDGNKTYKIMKV